MTSNDFTYWLQGYVEITNGAQPDATQWAIIKDHLALVFNKVTPKRFEDSFALPSAHPDSIYLSGCGMKPFLPDDPTLPTPDLRICGGLPFRGLETGLATRFISTSC